MNISTQAVQIGLEWDSRTGAVTVPIYQTATFRHPGLGQSTGYDYSRSGNPTRRHWKTALHDWTARPAASPIRPAWRRSPTCCCFSNPATT